MFKLTYVSPEKAEDQLSEIYAMFPEDPGPPLPLQLMSASQGFLFSQLPVIRYFGHHPRLSFPLLAAIRFMAATACDYDFCIRFNKKLLSDMGADSAEIEAILNDPDNAPLEADEKALLAFAGKAIRTPEQATEQDVQALRDLGWTDADILDAVAHGAFMRGHAVLMKAFLRN